jgi:putative tryptophan/tyrosine transport system substrate-binding protein
VDRRVFVGTVVLGLRSLPVLARAQGPATGVRIAYVTGTPAGAADLIGSFLEGLRALGYDEGRNLTLERRYDEAKIETLPGIFAQLVRLNLDAIVVVGPEARLRAASQAARGGVR